MGNARGSGYVDCIRRSKPVVAMTFSRNRREKNGKISNGYGKATDAILLADCIVTAELEGDRVIYEPGGVTRQCIDRGDSSLVMQTPVKIKRFRRSICCTVHLLQGIFFNTILD